MDVCLLWVLFFCPVEFSVSGWSFVQGSPTVCVCVCVCVSFSVIRCNNNPLHLQWVRRHRSRQERKKEYLTVWVTACSLLVTLVNWSM